MKRNYFKPSFVSVKSFLQGQRFSLIIPFREGKIQSKQMLLYNSKCQQGCLVSGYADSTLKAFPLPDGPKLLPPQTFPKYTNNEKNQ